MKKLLFSIFAVLALLLTLGAESYAQPRVSQGRQPFVFTSARDSCSVVDSNYFNFYLPQSAYYAGFCVIPGTIVGTPKFRLVTKNSPMLAVDSLTLAAAANATASAAQTSTKANQHILLPPGRYQLQFIGTTATPVTGLPVSIWFEWY